MDFGCHIRKSGYGTALVLFSAVLLSGCRHSAPAPEAPYRPIVQEALRSAAEKTTQAQERLSLTHQSRVLPQGVSMSDVPVELTKLVTIDWVGGVEGISERLALEAGYQFVRIGTPPAAPIVVDVVAHARPVFELLQHVGLQMRGRGELVINPSARKVEVRYATR